MRKVDTENIIEGRPDLADHSFGKTLLKKFPPYAYSSGANAALVHKIAKVEARWYDVISAEHLRRRDTPKLIATAICGHTMFLTSAHCLQSGPAKMCAIPRPDAVLCGMCHGTGRVFKRDGSDVQKRREAHRKLGCIAE